MPTVAAPLCPKIVGPTMSPPLDVSYCTPVIPDAPNITNFNRASRSPPEYFAITTRTVCGLGGRVRVAEELERLLRSDAWSKLGAGDDGAARVEEEHVVVGRDRAPRLRPLQVEREPAAGRERDGVGVVGSRRRDRSRGSPSSGSRRSPTPGTRCCGTRAPRTTTRSCRRRSRSSSPPRRSTAHRPRSPRWRPPRSGRPGRTARRGTRRRRRSRSRDSTVRSLVIWFAKSSSPLAAVANARCAPGARPCASSSHRPAFVGLTAARVVGLHLRPAS